MDSTTAPSASNPAVPNVVSLNSGSLQTGRRLHHSTCSSAAEPSQGPRPEPSLPTHPPTHPNRSAPAPNRPAASSAPRRRVDRSCARSDVLWSSPRKTCSASCGQVGGRLLSAPSRVRVAGHDTKRGPDRHHESDKGQVEDAGEGPDVDGVRATRVEMGIQGS